MHYKVYFVNPYCKENVKRLKSAQQLGFVLSAQNTLNEGFSKAFDY